MELPIKLSADRRTRQVGNFTSPKLGSVQGPLTTGSWAMSTRSGGAAWRSRRCTPGARRCGWKPKRGRTTMPNPRLWPATGSCGPTRIGCCCALVEGRPVSRVTTDFLAWGADRLAAEGKRVWVLVWDNAAWHVSKAVRAWIGEHNRTVKRTGGVRILVCRLPVKSPWLNPIEPRWLHGKRAIVEPDGPLTAHELMDRVHQHFGCERLQPLHQHVF